MMAKSKSEIQKAAEKGFHGKEQPQEELRDNRLNGGETGRYDCADCSTEFEVCYEPKAKGQKDDGTFKPSVVNHCPFCGSDAVTVT